MNNSSLHKTTKLLSLFAWSRCKWLKDLVNANIISLFKGKKRNLALVLLILFLKYKQKRGRKIIPIYQKNDTNQEILIKLEPMIKKYSPTFYLPFGILKSIANNKRLKFLDCYRRQEFQLSDGEIIALDFYPKNHHRVLKDVPIVLLVPGIFGDSFSGYTKTLSEAVYSQLGMRFCIFNRRGYGNMPFRVKKNIIKEKKIC